MKVIRQLQPSLSLTKSFAAIVAPLLAAVMAALLSVHIVYSGNLRDSLDAKAENLLIDASLRLRPFVPTSPSAISVVSLTDADLATLPAAPAMLRDATVAVYADVLAKIAASKPRFVVYSWLTNAHPVDAIDAAPLTAALDTHDLRARSLLSLPFINDSKIPEVLGKRLPLADGDDCIYNVNRICSSPAGWDDWIVKKLVRTFWTDIPKGHISSNLPYQNSFILNFPQPGGLRRLSFRQVLDGAALPPDGIYFVGNDVTQDLRFRDAKYVLQRTFTFDERQQRDLQQDGIPFHEFWARLVQMFEARTTIAVVPETLERVILGFYLLGLGLILLRFGVVLACAVLLSNILLLPVANAFSLSYAMVYLPVFDFLFGGVVLCVVGMMISVSWSDYRRFRAASVARHYRDVAEIKSNFVSLISHDLNTTVARLSGLLDIFKNSGLFAAQSDVVAACNRSIGELFVCVRNVLTSLSLGDRQRGVSVTRLRQVVADFGSTYAGMMRRIGVDFELEVAAEGEDGAYTGNVKALHQFLANLLSVSREFGAEGCLIGLAAAGAPGGLRIECKYFLPPDPDQLARAFDRQRTGVLSGFAQLILDYIGGVVASGQGTVAASRSGDNVVVTIELT